MARPRSDIPVRIIQAARDHFLQQGVDGASLRAIARDAGTNIGMIYYYHPTKDDLFLAVVEDIYSKLIDDLAAIFAAEASIEQRIHKAYRRLGAASDEEFMVVRIIIREALVSSERLERLVGRFVTGHVPLVLSMLGDGLTEGRVTDRHHPFVLAISTVILGLLPQLVRRQVPNTYTAFGGLPEGEELAHSLAELLLHGIGGGGAADLEPAADIESAVDVESAADDEPESSGRR